MSDPLQLIIDAVSRVKDIEPSQLSGSVAIEDLLMDSLDEVEVMMFLEDELGIEIDQAQIEECSTIEEFAAVVGQLMAQQK